MAVTFVRSVGFWGVERWKKTRGGKTGSRKEDGWTDTHYSRSAYEIKGVPDSRLGKVALEEGRAGRAISWTGAGRQAHEKALLGMK